MATFASTRLLRCLLRSLVVFEWASPAAKELEAQWYEECIVYFAAFSGSEKVKRLDGTFSKSMEAVRVFSGNVPILFYYTLIDTDNAEPIFKDRLDQIERRARPFVSINMGGSTRWSHSVRLRMHPSSSGDVSTQMDLVWAEYPNPLRAISWHMAARSCSRAIYLDSDVLVFQGVQALMNFARSVGTDIVAPMEPNTEMYCKDYEDIGVDQTTCLQNQPVSTESLGRAALQTCNWQGGEHMPLFQASVVVMGPKALQLFNSSTFVEEYLALCLRILDGSREFKDSFFSPNLWRVLPQTGAPVTLTSSTTGLVRTGITSQLAMYVTFACAGLSIGHFERRMVFTGQIPSTPLYNRWLHGEQPVAWHTQNPVLSNALAWYTRWFEKNAPPGVRPLSFSKGDTDSAKDVQAQVWFHNDGSSPLFLAWVEGSSFVPQGWIKPFESLGQRTHLHHRYIVSLVEDLRSDNLAAASSINIVGSGNVRCHAGDVEVHCVYERVGWTREGNAWKLDL